MNGKKAKIYKVGHGISLISWTVLYIPVERICYANGIVHIPFWLTLLEFIFMVATVVFIALRIYEEHKEKRNCQSNTESTEDGSENTGDGSLS